MKASFQIANDVVTVPGSYSHLVAVVEPTRGEDLIMTNNFFSMPVTIAETAGGEKHICIFCTIYIYMQYIWHMYECCCIQAKVMIVEENHVFNYDVLVLVPMQKTG